MFNQVLSRITLGGFRRGLAAGLAALTMVGTLAACGHRVDADADAVLQSPVATIVLDVTKYGLVVVAASDIPGVDDLAALGVWGVKSLQDHIDKSHSADPNATLLVITHTVGKKQEASIYRIDTNRTLQVTMNGKFIEEITPGIITISAQPGVASKIVVTDANSTERVYRQGTVTLWRKGYSANLDAGTTSTVTPSNAEIFRGLYSISTMNGTTVLPWQSPGQASLTACESFPASQWSGRLAGVSMHGISAGTTWCVHTSKGYYGAIVWQPPDLLIGDQFSYVLWKR
jgi:hypothetical protein